MPFQVLTFYSQKYLAENPIYEKKYKEERDKMLSANKASKKLEKEKADINTKLQTKQKNTEKDARVRANEKKWDKSVDDLDDGSTGVQKQEANKSQIKLSLKDQKQKSEGLEKAFGKFHWTKDKKNEEEKDGNKTPEAGQEKEKEKGKINFNINLSGKTGKSLIGKTGAQKKNPLLPPWQPVGKKTETVGKPGETANLDQFLTTNSGEGKIPVITEKKKISAKEILEAFTGKYKDKDAAVVAKQGDQEKEKATENITVNETQEQTVKTKKELEEEKEKRMMGIDPDSEVPLAEIKPPPPVSQNVPLPNQKPSATVDENDVHKVFNSETKEESENPVIVNVKVGEEGTKKEDVEMKEASLKIEAEQDGSNENAVKSEDLEQEKKMDLEADSNENGMSPIKTDNYENESSVVISEMKIDTTDESLKQENLEDEIKEGKNVLMSESIEINIVPKEDNTEILEKESETTKVEIIIEPSNPIQEEKESVPVEMEVDEKQEDVKENPETIDAKAESVDNTSENTVKEELPEVQKEDAKADTKTDDSDTEIEEPVTPPPAQRGRGRGRGKKRGGGRGRGRGKAKATTTRTTRAKRSAVTDVEETVDIVEPEKDICESENVDNSEANDSNKDLELNSSVKVAKTASGKKKKSASQKVKKSPIKSDVGKNEFLEELSDIEGKIFIFCLYYSVTF